MSTPFRSNRTGDGVGFLRVESAVSHAARRKIGKLVLMSPRSGRVAKNTPHAVEDVGQTGNPV